MSNRTNGKRIGAVIFLEHTDGHLAMQLRDDVYQWGLFGGWIESGERPKDGILREVQEELSVILLPINLSLKGIHSAFEGTALVHVFHCPVTNELDNAVLNEGVDWRFLSLNEIQSVEVVPHQRKWIQHYYT